MKMSQIALRLLASHHGGSGSIPGRDMSVSGPPVWDGDDLGQVSPEVETPT
jgi:hypothetical protein